VTFSLRYDADYRRAGVPTIPIVYGTRTAYAVIAGAAILAAATMLLAAWRIGVQHGFLSALFVLSGLLAVFAASCALHPNPRRNFYLFKFASLYMLMAMLLMAWGSR